MDKNFTPGVLDEQLRLEAGITRAGSFVGDAFDLGQGFAPGGVGEPMAAVCDVMQLVLGGSVGASTWALRLEESADLISWQAISADVTVDSATVMNVPGVVSDRYVRLVGTLAGATGTGTIGLSAVMTPNGFAAAR